MKDIERRLRESLRARAGDVEPTPLLWERVEQRIRRDRWRVWALAAAGTAAAVLAAVVVVPGLVDDGREVEILADPTPSPTATATEEPTPAPSETASEAPSEDGTLEPSVVADLANLVVTDGTTIQLATAAGDPVQELVTLPAEGEATIVSLEVRPGSTVDDLTVVFAAEAEGMSDLRYVQLRDGEVIGPEYLPDAYQVSPDTVADGTLSPVFSPDGRHLAWLEVPRGEPQGPAGLRTIGWTDDGPGTGETATDNAAFGLEDIDTEHPLTLEDWIWDEVAEDGSAKGELRAVGPAGLYHIAIERQADGGLAMPGEPVRLGGGGDGAFIDIDNAYVGDDAHGVPTPGPEFQLLAAGDGTQDAEGVAYTLLHAPPGGPTTEWPLPDLGPNAAPWGAWMNAHPETVVVGFGGQAWLVTADGAAPLPGQVAWADVVR